MPTYLKPWIGLSTKGATFIYAEDNVEDYRLFLNDIIMLQYL